MKKTYERLEINLISYRDKFRAIYIKLKIERKIVLCVRAYPTKVLVRFYHIFFANSIIRGIIVNATTHKARLIKDSWHIVLYAFEVRSATITCPPAERQRRTDAGSESRGNDFHDRPMLKRSSRTPVDSRRQLLINRWNSRGVSAVVASKSRD